MTFLDYITTHDVRAALMDKMMHKFGIDTQLRSIADHSNVTARAADRCRACGHQGECATWLDENEQPDLPPDYCRNGDLIARLQHAQGR